MPGEIVLSEEQKKELKATVESLKFVYKDCCAYEYNQIAELKKTKKYRKSPGVCHAMSIDWLRRLLFNLYNPSSKQKRNLDDPHFSGKKRVALTNKHGELHAAAKADLASKGPCSGVSSQIQAMVDARVVSSGMDKLSATPFDKLDSYQISEKLWAEGANRTVRDGAPNTHYKVKSTISDLFNKAKGKGVGVLMEMMCGTSNGHTVAMFFGGSPDPLDSRFFDPNLGEYWFRDYERPDRVVSLATDVWFDLYYLFFKMDQLKWTRIEYQ